MTMPKPDASRAGELRERAVRLWRWRYDLRSFFAPLSDDKQPHLSSMPTPRDADEYLALPAADMERLLAADALTRDAVVAALQTFCERFDIDYIEADVDACEQAARAALRPEGEKGVTPC